VLRKESAMRTPCIALLSAALIGGSLTLSSLACAAVDLNAPGAIESLARQNPDHYAKIERILADVARRPPETVPRWMNAEFGAQGVSFPRVLKTSDPPKRSLSFTLDATRYEAVVTVPARWSFATQSNVSAD